MNICRTARKVVKMKQYNISFGSEQDKIQFVMDCEHDFEARLDNAVEMVIEANARILLLSGPTCSGKTTTANKLISELEANGKKITIISIDDFFYDRDEGRVVQDDTKIDYDSIDVIDLPLLTDCINHAKVGNTIRVPIFDFISQKRVGYNQHVIESNEIIIFEGIQAVYPEIVSLIKEKYIGIFINVNDDACINNVIFTKNEIRFIRRIVRDRKFRGASADFTFYLWQTVRENEEKSIFPNKDICKIQLDSFMPYELFLMKKYAKETLSEVMPKSKYFEYAQKLINKLDLLDEISYDYIPSGSLYTEFLGKK